MVNIKSKLFIIVQCLIISSCLISCDSSNTTPSGLYKASSEEEHERLVSGDAKIKLEKKIYDLELEYNNITMQSFPDYKKIDFADNTVTLNLLLRGRESDTDLSATYKIVEGEKVEETDETYSDEFNQKLLAYVKDNDIDTPRKTFAKKDMVVYFESAIMDYANKTGDFNFEYTYRNKNSDIDLTQFTFIEKPATKSYPHVVDITGFCVYDGVTKTVTVEVGYDYNYKIGKILSTTGLDKKPTKKNK